MPSKLNPYLSFDGKAQEAMKYYETVFGGELTMTTFKEGGMPHDEADADKLMHAMLVADNGITLMAADTTAEMHTKQGNNIAISLSGHDQDELTAYWEKLADGGTVTVPMEKAPWGDMFGMLTDKFGISWMVNITAKKE